MRHKRTVLAPPLQSVLHQHEMWESECCGRRDWLAGLCAALASGGHLASARWLPAAGALLGYAAGTRGHDARAGAARAIPLEALVARSELVVVATIRSSHAQWENDGTERRIVSYHQLEVQQSVGDKSSAAGEPFVRTLGGVVGDVGQRVLGEAPLGPGGPSVLFLRQTSSGAFAVTAMAQGHYPLTADSSGAYRLSASPGLDMLVKNDPQSAVSRLSGRTVADCERMLAGVQVQ